MEDAVPVLRDLYLWTPLLDAQGLTLQEFAEGLLRLPSEYLALPVYYDPDGSGPEFAVYPGYAGHEGDAPIDGSEPGPSPKGPPIAVLIM
jgi:hypothetical protein